MFYFSSVRFRVFKRVTRREIVKSGRIEGAVVAGRPSQDWIVGFMARRASVLREDLPRPFEIQIGGKEEQEAKNNALDVVVNSRNERERRRRRERTVAGRRRAERVSSAGVRWKGGARGREISEKQRNGRVTKEQQRTKRHAALDAQHLQRRRYPRAAIHLQEVRMREMSPVCADGHGGKRSAGQTGVCLQGLTGALLGLAGVSYLIRS